MGRKTVFSRAGALALTLLGATAAQVTAQDGARIVSHTIPAVMVTNERVQVRVTVQNTGRAPMEFDVIEPLTGNVLQHLVLNAGERFELSGATAFILKGRFR